jgi:hypothetical protein
MQGLDYWFGPECEGRHTGIQTVFRRFALPSNWKNYPHIYFTIEAVREFIKSNDWDEVIDILNNTFHYITCEIDTDTIDKIPKRVYNHVHLLYRVQIPKMDIDKLKKMDTVTLDCGSYNIYAVAKNNLQKVTADDYAVDRIKE